MLFRFPGGTGNSFWIVPLRSITRLSGTSAIGNDPPRPASEDLSFSGYALLAGRRDSFSRLAAGHDNKALATSRLG
jgi:hypothetical protein